MSDLVKRGLLASMCAFVSEHARGIGHEMGDAVILIDEAADRIEQLEAALREIERFGKVGVWPAWEMGKIARNALSQSAQVDGGVS